MLSIGSSFFILIQLLNYNKRYILGKATFRMIYNLSGFAEDFTIIFSLQWVLRFFFVCVCGGGGGGGG